MKAEPISFVLDKFGEVLDFTGTIVGCIAGNEVKAAASYDSVNDIEIQTYHFQIEATFIDSIPLSRGTTFTYTFKQRKYFFKVLKFSEDLTGWGYIEAVLQSVQII